MDAKSIVYILWWMWGREKCGALALVSRRQPDITATKRAFNGHVAICDTLYVSNLRMVYVLSLG